jgi:hypothetical protein
VTIYIQPSYVRDEAHSLQGNEVSSWGVWVTRERGFVGNRDESRGSIMRSRILGVLS